MSRLAEGFVRDRTICRRGVVPPDLIHLLLEGTDANIANPSSHAKVASYPYDPGRADRRPRRVFAVRFLGDDAGHVPHGGATSRRSRALRPSCPLAR